MLQEENQICRLPPELLGQIFRDAVFPPSEPDAYRSSPNYRSLTSPYSISHVCRQWRDTALNYSLLWTRLSIKNPNDSELVNLLEVWMDRAGSLPLSFGLRVFKVKSKFATKAILRLFINSVHRCRDVTLVLASLSPNLIDMENLSLQHPYLLQNATIEFADKPNAKFDFLFNHIFSAPNLRSAKFFCEHQISLDKVAPSWGNLQELTVDVFSPALLISALAFCRNLKQLTISDTRTAGHIPIRRPITLPQLTYLSVSMGVCPSFFDKLLVPSLKEVHIQNVEGKSWGHLIRLLERSAVMIKVLTLEWSRWRSEEPDIMQSLGTSVFREMRVLYIKYPVGMKIVEFLTLPSRSNWESGMREHDCGSNLPHLQKLELFLYKPDPEDVSVTLSRLVESRLGTSDPETMRRCVHWGGMRAEVKLSMDGPTFN